MHLRSQLILLRSSFLSGVFVFVFSRTFFPPVETLHSISEFQADEVKRQRTVRLYSHLQTCHFVQHHPVSRHTHQVKSPRTSQRVSVCARVSLWARVHVCVTPSKWCMAVDECVALSSLFYFALNQSPERNNTYFSLYNWTG